MRSICDAYGILLIFDEVQSGVGRTGRWFCSEHAGVVPDIVTVGKAIGSGLPLSAVVAGREIMQRWEPGSHGTTFGGNPVSCAAARATLQVIRDTDLLPISLAAGFRALAFLQDLASRDPRIGEVRGLGCMIGVEFVDSGGAPDGPLCTRFLERCLAKGLILIGCGLTRNVARFLPPLNVSPSEMEEALDICAAVLAEIS